MVRPKGIGPQVGLLRPDEDLGLVRRCRSQDRSAWKVLYERHYDFVFSVARRLGTPHEEADDVAQEVFMVVFAKLDRFQEGKLNTWLFRITSNVVSHHHRKRRTRRAVGAWKERLGLNLLAAKSPEQEAIATNQGEAIDRILERMNPKKREVFGLFELEGLSGEEVAERIGCPLGTVWSRLRHARSDFLRIGRRLELLEEES